MRQQDKGKVFFRISSALMLGIAMYSAPIALAAESTPCLDEIEKYCNDVKPGEGILDCLQGHDKELSTVCRDKIAANRKKILAAQQTCAKDIETFCKGVVPGGGRVLRCLVGHRDELTPACLEVITAGRKRTSVNLPAESTPVKPAPATKTSSDGTISGTPASK